MNIQDARNEIDQIDAQLVALYEKRMAMAEIIGKEKIKQNLPIQDVAREQQLISARCSQLADPELRPGLERVLGELIKVSKRHQRTLLEGAGGYASDFVADMVELGELPQGKVGYSGIPGSYAHEAACQMFPQVEAEGFNGFEEVFRHIGKGIDYGILPIENSSTGGIVEVYDLLRKYGAYIVGEHIVHVEHCLLGVRGSSISDVKKVISHREGIMQSKDYISQYHWESEALINTAVAAKQVAEDNDKTVAAIGSAKNAELYGLDILASGINFNSKNYTRFIVVAARPEYIAGADKISIYLSLPHTSGSLASLLDVFSDAGLNLVKIESRPIYKKTWEYYFYIDIQADIKDAATIRALDLAAEHSEYMEILGAYKAAQRL